MPCIPFRSADGTVSGFVCTRWRREPPCSVCKMPSSILCDYELTGTKAGKTCDRPLCKRCAVHVGPNRDLCPAHARAEQAAQGRRRCAELEGKRDIAREKLIAAESAEKRTQ